MTTLDPDDFLFYLDEQGGSLVDHQLPGTSKQRAKTLKAAESHPDFNVIPGHLTPCHCSVVSLSEKGRRRIAEVLRKEEEVKKEIVGAFEKGGHRKMSLPHIIQAIRTKTHYGRKHIIIILDTMVQEERLTLDNTGEDGVYSIV